MQLVFFFMMPLFECAVFPMWSYRSTLFCCFISYRTNSRLMTNIIINFGTQMYKKFSINNWILLILSKFLKITSKVNSDTQRMGDSITVVVSVHDDVIKWKHFPRYWPFVRGIHRSRWIPHTIARDAELWCFLLAWLNDWVNSRKAGDLRRHRGHYDVNVMYVLNCVLLDTEQVYLGGLQDWFISHNHFKYVIDVCAIHP